MAFQGVLFGRRLFQDALLRIARDGSVKTSEFAFEITPSAIASTALVTRSEVKYGQTWSLDPRHPAHGELIETLRALDPTLILAPIPQAGKQRLIRGDSPLGHSQMAEFLILAALTSGAMSESQLFDVVDQREPAVKASITSLIEDGVLQTDGSSIRYAPDVPLEYLYLVRKIEETLQGSTRGEHVAARKKRGLQRADDGAPRLFGSDARFRRLIILAVNGPMYAADLAILMGNSYTRPEDKTYAPFGRGGIVATWMTSVGPAVALDTEYPVAPELKRLLVALERLYPVEKLRDGMELPPIPAFEPWSGDKSALFGSAIPSGILFTVGVLGWTFESLCVSALVGKHRENVKEVLRSLEEEGILASDRPRRPGFDVRIVTLDKTFPAKPELEMLLKRCVNVWPDLANVTNLALANMPKKTLVHLQNRGIISGGKPKKKKSPTQFSPERKAAVLMEYYALAKTHGRSINSSDLMKMGESGLYFRIRAAFGGFADFQKVLADNEQ